MRQQLGEEENRKKRPKSTETGSKERHLPDVLLDEEIDPADFFGPEEFGYGRRGFDAKRA